MPTTYSREQRCWVRFGDLQGHLAARVPQFGQASKVIRRDMARYIAILELAPRIPLTYEGARAVVQALAARPVKVPGDAALLWTQLTNLGAPQSDVEAIRDASFASILALVDVAEQLAVNTASPTRSDLKEAGLLVTG